MSQGFKRNSKFTTKRPIYIFLQLIQHIYEAVKRTSPDATAVFLAKFDGRFIEIEHNRKRKNFIVPIKALIFLEAELAIEAIKELDLKGKDNSSILKDDFTSRTDSHQ